MVITPKRTIGSLVAAVLAILALADAPEQAAKLWNGITGAIASMDTRVVLIIAAVVIGSWAWDVHERLIAKFWRTPEAPQLRVLERYFMRLAVLQKEIDYAITFEVPDVDAKISALNLEMAKLRGELINMAPALLSTATALDLKTPDSRYIDIKKHAPFEVDRLLNVVRIKWQAYGGK